MAINRPFLTATTAMILIARFGFSPALGQAQTPAARVAPASTAAIGSPASVDTARTLPCRRFHQVPDGAWVMIVPAQSGTANVDTAVFPKGTAEAAILSQRCLP